VVRAGRSSGMALGVGGTPEVRRACRRSSRENCRLRKAARATTGVESAVLVGAQTTEGSVFGPGCRRQRRRAPVFDATAVSRWRPHQFQARWRRSCADHYAPMASPTDSV
jgi:hypothetical protein